MHRQSSAPSSRLNSFIRRLCAQRDILDAVCSDLIDGPVIELGLGNGRTYSHLRSLMPDRRIVAFDRAVCAHRSSIPRDEDLVLGDIRDTARRFAGIDAALVHADLGTGYEDLDARTLEWLPGHVAGLLAEGGMAVSGLPLEHPLLEPATIPDSVPKDRYFLYRRRSGERWPSGGISE